jgi:hypothetical protein
VKISGSSSSQSQPAGLISSSQEAGSSWPSVRGLAFGRLADEPCQDPDHAGDGEPERMTTGHEVLLSRPPLPRRIVSQADAQTRRYRGGSS